MVKLQNLYYNEEEIVHNYFRLYIYLGYQRGKHKFICRAAVIRGTDADTELKFLILSSGWNMYVSEEKFQDFIPIEKNRDLCKLIVKAIFSKLDISELLSLLK